MHVTPASSTATTAFAAAPAAAAPATVVDNDMQHLLVLAWRAPKGSDEA